MEGRNSNYIVRDILWYLAGSAVPMLIGIIRSPIYTRIFTPEEYGYYSLTYITFNYLSIAFFSWISSCIWRYYNQYKREQQTGALFSTALLLFLLSAFILGIITTTWFIISKDDFIKQLIILSYFYFLSSELIAVSLIHIRAEGKARIYNIVHSSKTLLAFLLLLYLTFILDHRIEAFLSSVIWMNLAVITGMSLIYVGKFSIRYIRIQYKDVRLLLKYGLVGIVSNLSLVLLATSDRFIIKFFDTIDHVGIYNQIYTIGQISVAAFVNVFFAAINPSLLKNFEHGFKQSNILTRKFIYMFIFLILPLTVYFSLFAKQIAIILLGEEFRVGYPMIPFIMISAFVYGLALFHEIKMKFANAFTSIILGFFIAAAINIVLNILLIPLFGYEMAAVTTLIAYSLLFLYFYIKDTNRYLTDVRLIRNAGLLLAVLAMELFIDMLIRRVIGFDLNVFYTIIEGVVFVILFLIITWPVNPFVKRKGNIYDKEN